MCGIAGIVTEGRDPKNIIHEMNNIQNHRGPDGSGTYINNNIALGHVRLSILDLSNAGAQPMHYENLVITYNGEIYNFREIRTSLVSNGYSFTSNSDTEVLIKAWHFWGINCLNKLDGMFAFAILDKRSGKLTLCRDAYGVKPLYYSHTNLEFIFASELATVKHALGNKVAYDKDAISTFLALHFVPQPLSGYEGVYKLEAGCLITFDTNKPNNSIQTTKWANRPTANISAQMHSIDDIDMALKNAVTRQMVSDVPVGAFLSGGVDSSLLCHYASQNLSERIHTFSIGFSDVDEEHDETRFAKIAANTINSIHHPVQIKLGEVGELINDNQRKVEILNADTSVFLNEIICEEASKHVKVCISGAGGDELFAGYYRHQAFLAIQYLNKVPEFTVKSLKKLINFIPQHRDSKLGNFVRRLNHFLNQRTSNGNFVSMLRNDGHFVQSSSFLDTAYISTMRDALDFDLKYFLGENIFSFTDKVSMKYGLEVRVPFLDNHLIQVARELPVKQQINLLNKKILLKKIAAQYFPKNIIYRKKQGFSAPLEIWMRSQTPNALLNLCLDGIAPRFVDEHSISKMIHSFLLEKADHSTQIYSFIILNQWGKNI